MDNLVLVCCSIPFLSSFLKDSIHSFIAMSRQRTVLYLITLNFPPLKKRGKHGLRAFKKTPRLKELFLLSDSLSFDFVNERPNVKDTSSNFIFKHVSGGIFYVLVSQFIFPVKK